MREGKLKSFHTLEIPFVLANVDEAKAMTGTAQNRLALQDRMSTAWAAFARTGNPNHKGLPNWPAFVTKTRATMVFDDTCKVVNDPNGAERVALASLTARVPDEERTAAKRGQKVKHQQFVESETFQLSDLPALTSFGRPSSSGLVRRGI